MVAVSSTTLYDEQWLTSACVHLYTHACNTSFGSLFDRLWFSATFDYVGIPSRRSITFKELFAITVAVTIWSTFLQSRKIIFHCDNQSVVHILNSGISRCHHIMSLIHYLFYVCCKFNIDTAAVHINSITNQISYVTLHRNLMLKVKARSRHACTTLLACRRSRICAY